MKAEDAQPSRAVALEAGTCIIMQRCGTRIWSVCFVRCLEAFKTCCQSKPYAGLDYPACGDVSLFFRQQQIFLELLPTVLLTVLMSELAEQWHVLRIYGMLKLDRCIYFCLS